jgi:hypothetical protein
MYVWLYVLVDTFLRGGRKKRKLFRNSKNGRHIGHSGYNQGAIRLCGCPDFFYQVDIVDIAGKKWTFFKENP